MTDYDDDRYGPADVELDRLINRELDAFDTKRKWSSQASPDGMSKGSGRWRVIHDCAAPKTGSSCGYPDPHGRVMFKGLLRSYLTCRGCGQAFTYEAIGEEDGREIIAISDANWNRFKDEDDDFDEDQDMSNPA